jgi:hypothetical protein
MSARNKPDVVELPPHSTSPSPPAGT